MSINFEFFKECVNEDSFLQRKYNEINELLECAEAQYWEQPIECAKALRKIAEDICHVYNQFYKVGMEQEDSIESYLCYGDEDEHNRSVSFFFSAVGNEQRNRLNEVRTLADQCIYLEDHDAEREKSGDMVAIDVKQMMITTMAILKELCKMVNGREDVSDYYFVEESIPKKEDPAIAEALRNEPKWKKVLRFLSSL